MAFAARGRNRLPQQRRVRGGAQGSQLLREGGARQSTTVQAVHAIRNRSSWRWPPLTTWRELRTAREEFPASLHGVAGSPTLSPEAKSAIRRQGQAVSPSGVIWSSGHRSSPTSSSSQGFPRDAQWLGRG